MAQQVTESELIVEANEIYDQKKLASKSMNTIAAETSKFHKIPKPVLGRLKSYYLYSGKGWTAKDPLTIDKTKDFKTDVLSPVFAKLLQVIDDLRLLGDTDFLAPYITALQSKGIDIFIKDDGSKLATAEDIKDAVNSMGTWQKQVDSCDKEIKEEKSEEAEDINLTKKSEFSRLVAFYNKKINKGNDAVEDQYHDLLADYELIESGYTKVFDESLS